jgi:hypothetical protein
VCAAQSMADNNSQMSFSASTRQRNIDLGDFIYNRCMIFPYRWFFVGRYGVGVHVVVPVNKCEVCSIVFFFGGGGGSRVRCGNVIVTYFIQPCRWSWPATLGQNRSSSRDDRASRERYNRKLPPTWVCLPLVFQLLADFHH